MKFMPKSLNGKKRRARSKPTFVSAYPIVNRMMNSDPLDALFLEMEMEMWSEEEIRAAFDTGMSPEQQVYKSWNDAWAHLGEELNRVFKARIDALPEEQRRQVLDAYQE